MMHRFFRRCYTAHPLSPPHCTTLQDSKWQMIMNSFWIKWLWVKTGIPCLTMLGLPWEDLRLNRDTLSHSRRTSEDLAELDRAEHRNMGQKHCIPDNLFPQKGDRLSRALGVS